MNYEPNSFLKINIFFNEDETWDIIYRYKLIKHGMSLWVYMSPKIKSSGSNVIAKLASVWLTIHPFFGIKHCCFIGQYKPS